MANERLTTQYLWSIPRLLLVFAALAATAWGAFTPPSSVPFTASSYADRAARRNYTGVTSLAAYASPASCSAQANLFSQDVYYTVPVLSLPGRTGLGLTLTLSYNSKVWVKSGSTVYFDGDKGWALSCPPAPRTESYDTRTVCLRHS